MKVKCPCAVCGTTKKITVHHMRDIHDKVYFYKSKKRKANMRGLIHLCRDCHDLVETIVTKKKLKKMGYQQGFRDGYESHKNGY